MYMSSLLKYWFESHTFTGLNSSTSYSIRVKVVDSGGIESTVASKSVTTSAMKVIPPIYHVVVAILFVHVVPKLVKYVPFNSSLFSKLSQHQHIGHILDILKLHQIIVLPKTVIGCLTQTMNGRYLKCLVILMKLLS